MEEDKPNTFQKGFSNVQMKAIAAIVGGLLGEVPKDHIGVSQLENVIRPPYLQNKQ